MIDILLALAFSAPTACTDIRVVDGDTIWACGVKHRMFGYQAPEMSRKNCRRIQCIEGDGQKSKDALAAELAKGPVTLSWQVRLDGTPAFDFYRRNQTMIFVNGKNVVCPLIAGGFGIHKPDYDKKGLVLADCGVK